MNAYIKPVFCFVDFKIEERFAHTCAQAGSCPDQTASFSGSQACQNTAKLINPAYFS